MFRYREMLVNLFRDQEIVSAPRKWAPVCGLVRGPCQPRWTWASTEPLCRFQDQRPSQAGRSVDILADTCIALTVPDMV